MRVEYRLLLDVERWGVMDDMRLRALLAPALRRFRTSTKEEPAWVLVQEERR